MNGVGLMLSFCFLSLVQNSEKDNGKQNVSLQLVKSTYKEHVNALYLLVFCTFLYYMLSAIEVKKGVVKKNYVCTLSMIL